MDANNTSHHHPLSNGVNVEEANKKPIRLLSPSGGEKIVYTWREEAALSVGHEIRETIRCATNFFTELSKPLKGKLDEVNLRDYDQVRSLAKRFNKAVHQIRKENPSHFAIKSDSLSKELLRTIVAGSYNRAVVDEKALNKHYEAFSSETYGETSYDRMQMIIDEIKPTESDVFVDLGSGVGQLVVQMSGATQVSKAVGIEKANLPAKFAQTLGVEYKK